MPGEQQTRLNVGTSRFSVLANRSEATGTVSVNVFHFNGERFERVDAPVLMDFMFRATERHLRVRVPGSKRRPSLKAKVALCGAGLGGFRVSAPMETDKEIDRMATLCGACARVLEELV